MPYSTLRVLLILAALAVFIAFVQLGVLSIAFDKLGLSRESASLMLMVTLAGSLINVPLFKVKAEGPPPAEALPKQLRELLGLQRLPFTGQTVVAINVGGGVTPAAFSLYLFANSSLGLVPVLVAVGAVAALSYLTSYPVPGIGFSMPFLLAPVTAAIIASALGAQHAAQLAYIAGTLGVLIGADLLHLRDIGKLGAPLASIGGAGTFDGIFLTGLLAVLLA